MSYTYSITSKGQITIPKEFRDKLGLDTLGKATLAMNNRGEIVITQPKTLAEVRQLLGQPSFQDSLSDKEQTISRHLAQKYDVR